MGKDEGEARNMERVCENLMYILIDSFHIIFISYIIGPDSGRASSRIVFLNDVPVAMIVLGTTTIASTRRPPSGQSTGPPCRRRFHYLFCIALF